MSARRGPASRRLPGMIDDDGLRKKIDRLGDNVPLSPAGRRHLSAPDADGLLKLVLREIDETILPRALSLMIGDAETARLTVKGGRILSLSTPAATVTGTDFDDPVQFAATLAAGLARAVGKAATLEIASARIAQLRDADGLRCATGPIAAALGRRVRGVAGLRQLAEALSPALSAWLLADGDGRIAASEGADASTLRDLSETSRQLDAATGGPGCDGMVVTGLAPNMPGGVLAARSDGAVLVARLPEGGSAQDAVRLWHDMFGT